MLKSLKDMRKNNFTKLHTFTITFLSVCSLFSCSNEEDPVVHTLNQPQKQISNPYTISEDSALSYLNEFLNDSDDKTSRSANNRIVASIIPIKYSQVAGKATRSEVECENLIYVANFENDQGYAILAADERIGEKVIAVTDEGYLSETTVYSSMQQTDSGRYIISGYPTTGPGFLTTPETGDEIFMNPNTVSMYVESEQDTLVGNLVLDEDDCLEYVEYDSSMQPSQTTFSAPQLMTSSLCVSYAVNEINNYNNTNELMPPVDNSGLINLGGDGPVTTVQTYTSGWTIKKQTYPKLYQFKQWTQKAPFNDLYPERRKFLFFGKKRKAFAGCFPLAIAKILTYLECPPTFTFNGYAIDWKELKCNAFSDKGRTSAAHLLKAISTGCESWYFYNGTFTFPKRASSYMRAIGFENAHRQSYKFERVADMLDNGKPLIIYALPGIKIWDAHCWNIDGYKVKERTTTTIKIINDEEVENKVTTETSCMVHCDFGWGGNSNGYYVSGIFKLNDSDVELDSGSQYCKTTNYNNYLHVITY